MWVPAALKREQQKTVLSSALRKVQQRKVAGVTTCVRVKIHLAKINCIER